MGWYGPSSLKEVSTNYDTFYLAVISVPFDIGPGKSIPGGTTLAFTGSVNPSYINITDLHPDSPAILHIGPYDLTFTYTTSSISVNKSITKWPGSGNGTYLAVLHSTTNNGNALLWYNEGIPNHGGTSTTFPRYNGTRSAYYGGAIAISSDSLLLGEALYKEYIDITTLEASIDKTIWPYTGERIEPEVTIKNDDYVLVQGTDYSLSYTNNINPGIGTVVATGGGDYTGSLTFQFTIINTDDPYDDGGTTDEGGGDGTFDNESDTISVPSLPTLSSLNSKFVTLWTPTLAQLQAFSTWLWTNTGLVDSIIKVYANPIDYILGLHIVPVNISYADYVINIGNISSGVTMRRALIQYVPVDCGTIDVEEYWGGYLDYSPYTKLQLYLPFIGFIQLDADTVMGRTLGVKYNCDILSGSCVAFVTVNDTIAYTFTGNIASQIPISNNDMSRIVGGTVTGIGTGVGLGLKAATAVGGGIGGLLAAEAAGLAGGIATGVISSKQQVGRSGTISSIAGLLNYKKPFLAIDRPRQALPDNQNKYTGYPGFITVSLSELIGFTKIEHIHLDNVPATDAEIDEILTILHDGFII